MPDERHLWADPAARAPQRGWFERSAASPPAPPQGEESPPPPSRRGRIALTVALALLALGSDRGARAEIEEALRLLCADMRQNVGKAHEELIFLASQAEQVLELEREAGKKPGLVLKAPRAKN